MTPAETREWVLADHRRLRAALDALEELARTYQQGERTLLGSLRNATERFLNRFEEHTRWEDEHLRPVLIDADAWGAERAKRLDHDHKEQRELLDYSLGLICDPGRSPVLIGRGVIDLIALIRSDMEEEERDLLDPRVLRDDVVGIDTETG